jgi:hypothetical protein
LISIQCFVQVHLKERAKKINANESLSNAANELVSALADFNQVEVLQEGELVSA